jgi:hypothetical protein
MLKAIKGFFKGIGKAFKDFFGGMVKVQYDFIDILFFITVIDSFKYIDTLNVGTWYAVLMAFAYYLGWFAFFSILRYFIKKVTS